MPEKFEVQIEAERFIRNDLSNCAFVFREAMKKKFECGETDGVYLDMMESLIFCAFAVGAKVNFVGWKVLKTGRPERANLREKIDLLIEVLKLDLTWGAEPLETIQRLRRLRDVLAHGKPEVIEDEVRTVDQEPEVWELLKSQWEDSVKPEFVDSCYEVMNVLWKQLIEPAEIDVAQTLTLSHHTLRRVVGRKIAAPGQAKGPQA